MTTQHDSIQPSEYVLRRVLNQASVIDTDLPQPVQRIAFRPTDEDLDGISVFRALFTTAEEVAAGKSAHGYYVVRIPVNEILDLGLTVVPDPQVDTLEGHSLIPELTSHTRKTEFSKKKQQQLAGLVNKDIRNRLVYSPL